MKNRVYITDGHDRQQTFSKFADARRAAMHAPWSNGTVYRHPASSGLQQADQGKLVFTAPGAPYPRT